VNHNLTDTAFNCATLIRPANYKRGHSHPTQSNPIQCNPESSLQCLSALFIGMEPMQRVYCSRNPMQGFGLFQMDRNIIFLHFIVMRDEALLPKSKINSRDQNGRYY